MLGYLKIDATELKQMLNECMVDTEEIKQKIKEFNNKYSFTDIEAVIRLHNERFKEVSMDLVRINEKRG